MIDFDYICISHQYLLDFHIYLCNVYYVTYVVDRYNVYSIVYVAHTTCQLSVMAFMSYLQLLCHHPPALDN